MLWDSITDWLKELLSDGIIDNLTALFYSVDSQIMNAVADIGATPADWNSTVYNFIHQVAINVLLPIGGVIMAIVMTLELIELITEKNNLNDVDTWMFFRWVFRSAVGVLLLSHTWDIVMGIFDVATEVVVRTGIESLDTGIDYTALEAALSPALESMSVGALLGLWFQSLMANLTTIAVSICIFIVVWGRMMEIFIVTSVAPIPIATMMDKEYGGWSGGMGKRYLRSLFALAFQGFLIMLCVAIYAVLIRNIPIDTDHIAYSIWTCIGYTILLCIMMFKTGAMSKAIFGG